MVDAKIRFEKRIASSTKHHHQRFKNCYFSRLPAKIILKRGFVTIAFTVKPSYISVD